MRRPLFCTLHPLYYSSKVTPEHSHLALSFLLCNPSSRLSPLLVRPAAGCCSDTEAESVFRMADNKDNVSYRRSVSITPKSSTPFNQFLPTKDKPSGYVPAPLRRKRAERNEDSRRSWANSSYAEDEGTLTRYCQITHNTLKHWEVLLLISHQLLLWFLSVKRQMTEKRFRRVAFRLQNSVCASNA